MVVVVDRDNNTNHIRRLDKEVMRLVLWVALVVRNIMDRKEAMGIGVGGHIRLGCEWVHEEVVC